MNKKTLIIILVAVVLVVGAAVAVIFVLDPFGGGEREEPVELFSYVPGEVFVTNLYDSSSLFKTSMTLILDEELTEELDANLPIIRDTIIKQLRNLGKDELSSPTIMDELRARLVEELNEALGIDNIVTLYFSDFVMQ